ncbi:Acetyltransferase (GNAT) family protein [Burkholderia sp. GAS332]|nr:Acetyltransferase (GNAT) family protein [Burkholderia sp. GAS332]
MKKELKLRQVEGDTELLACHAVMVELRPHLHDPNVFARQVMRQRERGYRLLAAWDKDRPVGLVGYRLQENLMYGEFMYVDDLVVLQDYRRDGAGTQLLSAVRAYARKLGCRYFTLDTGLSMALAQRFYYRQGLLGRGMCFSEPLFGDESAS